MDAYDRCTNLGKKKNPANIIAIYGRGGEIFRPSTYVTMLAFQYRVVYNFPCTEESHHSHLEKFNKDVIINVSFSTHHCPVVHLQITGFVLVVKISAYS
jgi:hypothetical protein